MNTEQETKIIKILCLGNSLYFYPRKNISVKCIFTHCKSYSTGRYIVIDHNEKYVSYSNYLKSAFMHRFSKAHTEINRDLVSALLQR